MLSENEPMVLDDDGDEIVFPPRKGTLTLVTVRTVVTPPLVLENDDSEKPKDLLWKERDELTEKLDVARLALRRIATEQYTTSGLMRDVAVQALEATE